MLPPHHHHFATSRSLRRPTQLPRPSLFLTSSGIFPSYNGASPVSMFSNFGTLPRRTVSQMALTVRQMPEPQSVPCQQPYCTVEEIKQGKRRREEENHYDEESQEGREEDSDDYADGLYEKAPNSRPNSFDLKLNQPTKPPLPPPLPPPIPFKGKGGKNSKNSWKLGKPGQHSPNSAKEMFKQRRSRTKFVLLFLLLLLCAMLLLLPLLILWLSVPTEWPVFGRNVPEHRTKLKPENHIEIPISGVEAKEMLVEPAKLTQWLAGNGQKLRIFEVRDSKRNGEPNSLSIVPRSRQLQIGALSHNGVPVHPLQFQRLLRAQGVDSDSLVVLYDRHPQSLYAAYALWIFRLYGLGSSFMLNGGLSAWHEFAAKNGLNSTADRDEDAIDRRAGTFRAEWHSQLIATFDDLIVNFEPDQDGPKADIVDAQNNEEFEGKSISSASSESAIFGHIRTAVNIPVERLFTDGRMLTVSEEARLFASSGLSTRRPVIVYDGFSSLRAAALWTALHRTNFTAALYFGAWPEWLIRAPDHLKIIPDK